MVVEMCMLCTLQIKTMNIESTSLEKDLSTFTRIVHKGIGKLVLKKGDKNHIRITSKAEILDLIRAEVLGDTLEIKMTDPIEVGLRSVLKLRTPDYRIEVTCTDLKEVIQRGMGNVENEGILQAEEFKIENRGVGDVHVNIQAKTLYTGLMGVGNITLTGEVDEHTAEIKGTGNFEAIDLQTNKTHITSSGVGNSRIAVREELNATLNGVGRIVYRGKPRVQSKLNGLGSIVSE
jgi:hypothetical protein